MRNPECTHYDECLSTAAHLNGPLVCDHCPRFQKRPEGSEATDLDGIFALLEAVLLEEGTAAPGTHTRT